MLEAFTHGAAQSEPELNKNADILGRSEGLKGQQKLTFEESAKPGTFGAPGLMCMNVLGGAFASWAARAVGRFAAPA